MQIAENGYDDFLNARLHTGLSHWDIGVESVIVRNGVTKALLTVPEGTMPAGAVSMVLAAYDKNGRMLGADLAPAVDGRDTVFTLSAARRTDQYRIFFVDADFRPVSEPIVRH